MISITSIGVYYIKLLLGRFHYIDLILQDTPIYDDEFYKELAKVFPNSEENGNRNVSQRKLSVEKFVDYLTSQEKSDKKFIENFEDK